MGKNQRLLEEKGRIRFSFILLSKNSIKGEEEMRLSELRKMRIADIKTMIKEQFPNSFSEDIQLQLDKHILVNTYRDLYIAQLKKLKGDNMDEEDYDREDEFKDFVDSEIEEDETEEESEDIEVTDSKDSYYHENDNQ